MLIESKRYYCFCIFVISLLCYSENSFCSVFEIQKNHFIKRYTDSFYHSHSTTNKTVKEDYDQIVLNSKKTQQITSTSESSGSVPWSNAFNFKKVWGTTVDPRTGILSTWVKTGSMLSNLGHGPDINLEVSYSSSALANPDGLGTGWNWNLTHFNLTTHQLTTSFGQNFYLNKQSDGHWWPLYHKLHDMHIQGDISTHFIITYANGLQETLNHQGYEIRLEQQDGWSVHFSYIPGTHLLQSVKDDEGHIITLHRTKNYIAVINQGSTGKPVVVLIHKKNNELHSITLPSFCNHSDHGIYFHYAQHFLTSVDYPTGLKKHIIYNCRDEIKIPVNDSSLYHAMCVVVKETTNPSFGQPVIVNRYHYGKTNANEHNYLGFNAELNTINHLSKDELFEAPANYTYKTEQDNGLIREIRTYNKYHLMTDEQQVSYRTGHILSAVHYFFCRTDQSDGCAHTSFADLPVFYSLPLKIVTRVWGNSSEIPAVTKVMADYDSQGRVIRQTDTFGRVTLNRYCPLAGDVACPPVSKIWSFGTLTESTIFYPVHTKADITPLPPVIIRNYYHKEINHNGKGYISVLDHQIQQAGKQQLTTTHYYYNNPEDLLTYGLLKKTILTGRQNNKDSPEAVTKDYYYIKSPDNYTKTIYSAIELSQNKYQISSYVTTSLFTNQILTVEDTEKKYSDRYYYDQWDRLIKIKSAAGTPFVASINYNYTISKNFNQVLITAANGLQKKVLFDGAGRALINFTEVIDKAGKQQPGKWWPVKKIYYDKYGRITRQSSYVINAFGHATTRDTTQDYDDTGRVIRVHLPDGGVTVMHYDDSNRCVMSYQKSAQGEASVISVSRANILNKPVKQWILPATKMLLPPVKSLCLNSDKQPEARVSLITYDGFGRPTSAQDSAGRIVRQHYDSLGRLTDTIDPTGNRMHQVYNLTGQIVQSWAYPVSGGHYLLSSARYNKAGQLIWSTGEDRKRTFYTYTTDGQIATLTTPSGNRFSWQYNILNLPVSESIDNQQQWITNYMPVTLALHKKTDATGTTTYTYSDDGLVQKLIHRGKNNYPDYTLQWQYDNNRRIVSTTDISGNKTNTGYDWLGRVDHINYKPHQNNSTEKLFLPVYDGFSRIKNIRYGSDMYRSFHYDLWGHKDQIIDIQKEQLIYKWLVTYDIFGNIIRLSQKTEKKQYGMLHYQYDVLDNLISMYCRGSPGLPLCPHDTSFAKSKLLQAPVITQQHYTFTPLNRLASIKETLQPIQNKQTVSKSVNYHYTDYSAPLRLQQISTVWNHDSPVLQNFSYDKMGNMTTDGDNNHISYNNLNEVIRVISSTGKQSNYNYNGNGQKVMEKSLDGISYLFYRGDALINEKIISPEKDVHVNGYLGVAKATDGIINEYYESSYKGDITGIFRKNNSRQYKLDQRNIYSPYGMVWHKKRKTLLLYQQTLQGFDGERTDPSTGWQFLGNGNRTYNPLGRYFLSEDPAGDGYAFGSNNPIMSTDSSGNSPQWLGEVFRWANYISTMGLGALHQRWANITASVIQAGCTVATLGAAVAGAGASALAGVVAGTATIGSIPVVASAIPANKGLNIAGKIIGMAEMAVTVATGLAGFLPLNMAAGETATEDIPLAKIPFEMLTGKQKTAVTTVNDEGASSSASVSAIPVLRPSLPSVSLNEILEQSPYFFYKRGKFPYLNLLNRQSVEETLSLLLNSPFKDNIACDTGSIFLVYQRNGQVLHTNELTKFLSVRMRFIGQESPVSSDHPYLKALKNILDRANPYGSKFRYHIGNYYDKSLLNIFQLTNCVLLSGYNHMAVVERIQDSAGCKSCWNVYQFNSKGNIKIVSIEKYMFSKIFYNPHSPDKLLLNGYMGIGGEV